MKLGRAQRQVLRQLVNYGRWQDGPYEWLFRSSPAMTRKHLRRLVELGLADRDGDYYAPTSKACAALKVLIHVNMNVIRKNQRTGSNDPPITIRRGSRTWYEWEVELIGESRIVYRPNAPLKCGARVWIETEDWR